MDNRQIIMYYNTESSHGYHSLEAGCIIMLSGILLWYFSNASTLFTSFAITLIIGSTIFILGGLYAGVNAKRSLPEKLASYKKQPKEFIENETKKVESIHKGWLGIRIFWTLFFISGTTIIFLFSKPIWVGTAIGLMVIGAVGHIEEAISFQHNNQYRVEILKELERIKTIN